MSFLGKKVGEEGGGGEEGLGGLGGFWGTFVLEFVNRSPYFLSGVEGGLGKELEGGEWEGGERVGRMKEIRGVFTKMLGMLNDSGGEGGGGGLLEVEAGEVGRHLTCWEFLLQKSIFFSDFLRLFFIYLFIYLLFFFFFYFIFIFLFLISFFL